jgi:phage shock protein C
MTRGRLVRPLEGKMIAGVCAGLSNFYGISVTRLRVAFVVFGLFGAGEVVYIALWIFLPRER